MDNGFASHLLRCGACLLLPTAFSGAFAHTNDSLSELLAMDLRELVNTPVESVTRHSEKLADVPATVYVVTEAMIRNYGYRDLKDILKHIPGVEYADPHSWLQGGQRGFSDNWSKSKLLIDGVEVNLLYSGEAFIGHQFMAANIARVEFIQGPGSVLYGADAFSGIINIVTKGRGGAETEGQAATELRLRGDMGGDEYQGWQGSAYHHGQGKQGGLSVFVGHRDLHDVDYSDFVTTAAFSEPQPERSVRTELLNSGAQPYRDQNEASQVDLSAYYHLGSRHEFEGKLLWLSDIDGGGLESPDISFTHFRTERDQLLGHAEYRYQFDRPVRLSLRYDYHRADELNDLNLRELDTNNQLSPLFRFDTEHSTEHIAAGQLDFTRDIFGGYSLLGAGYREKDLPLPVFVEKQPPYNPADFSALQPFQNQRVNFVYAQTQQQFLQQRLEMILGIRYEDHSIYDSPTTIRSGLGYKFNQAWRIKWHYGESFRSPTMFELETNAGLNPAELKSNELLLQYFSPSYNAQLSFYRVEAEDLIVTVFDSSREENFVSVNQGEADNEGAEFSIDTSYHRWSHRLWVTWTDSSNQDNISRWKAALLSTFSVSQKHSISAMFKWLSPVKTPYLNAASETRQLDMPSHYSLDMHWRWQRALDVTGLEINATLRNVTDKDGDYPNVRGNDPKQFAVQGINASLGLSYRF